MPKIYEGILSSDSGDMICKMQVTITSAGDIEKVEIYPVETQNIASKSGDAIYNGSTSGENLIPVIPLQNSIYAEMILARFHGDIIDIPHVLNSKTPFSKLVYETLYKIPYGKLTTYQEIATLCGNPKACQAVGNLMRNNPLPILYPCHRVIAKNDSLGGFHGSDPKYINIKKKLIELEKAGGKLVVRAIEENPPPSRSSIYA